jgi:hypothetical protein
MQYRQLPVHNLANHAARGCPGWRKVAQATHRICMALGLNCPKVSQEIAQNAYEPLQPWSVKEFQPFAASWRKAARPGMWRMYVAMRVNERDTS